MSRSQKTTSRLTPSTRTPPHSSRRNHSARVAVAQERDCSRLTVTLPRLSGKALEDAVKSLEVFAEMLEIRRAERPAVR